ncbi:MAG: hypothetical protein PHQ35_11180 [Phycisphaerae bacterium]|nr:hypothetical protein [Phycisphaerae bacterium]
MKAIFQGGVELVRGDDNLVQTILNNLTGANFAGRDDEYNGYVSYMSDKFGVKVNPSELKVLNVYEVGQFIKVNGQSAIVTEVSGTGLFYEYDLLS